jgi:subtilisin family serine protease
VPVLDDTVPGFANRGTATRHVDIVAPGVHILGLRVPNGVVDQGYPSARVGARFFRGSGTSQSTAVVSGAAALMFQRYPGLTPQQAKMLLGYGAQRLAARKTSSAPRSPRQAGWPPPGPAPPGAEFHRPPSSIPARDHPNRVRQGGIGTATS